MKKRFSNEQIISILREAEAGVSARELCRKHAISDATFYTWRVQAGSPSAGIRTRPAEATSPESIGGTWKSLIYYSLRQRPYCPYYPSATILFNPCPLNDMKI